MELGDGQTDVMAAGEKLGHFEKQITAAEVFTS